MKRLMKYWFFFLVVALFSGCRSARSATPATAVSPASGSVRIEQWGDGSWKLEGGGAVRGLRRYGPWVEFAVVMYTSPTEEMAVSFFLNRDDEPDYNREKLDRLEEGMKVRFILPAWTKREEGWKNGFHSVWWKVSSEDCPSIFLPASATPPTTSTSTPTPSPTATLAPTATSTSTPIPPWCGRQVISLPPSAGFSSWGYSQETGIVTGTIIGPDVAIRVCTVPGVAKGDLQPLLKVMRDNAWEASGSSSHYLQIGVSCEPQQGLVPAAMGRFLEFDGKRWVPSTRGADYWLHAVYVRGEQVWPSLSFRELRLPID
ncbi:hypothetical protein DRN75_03640 [Nanoarchaeota archaeon]|nr:MAG: hypothetical protein DRN75_03640 [Nanoarchaeota archaeon]